MARPWSDNEELKLRDLVGKNGRQWRLISESMEHRTPSACQKFWDRVKDKPPPEEKNEHPQPEFPSLSNDEVSFDEWLDLVDTIQNVRNRAHPIITAADVKIDTGGKPICVVFVSCIHFGGLYTFHSAIREKILELLDIPRLYFVFLGDEVEHFPPGWANTVFNNLIPPQDQRAAIGKLIDMVCDKGKLLAACWSNHPAFHERLTGEDAMEGIYKRNGIPYFHGKGILKLQLNDQLYVMNLAHDFPGSSIYNPNHAQGRQRKEMNWADVVASGHKHKYAFQMYEVNQGAFDAGLTPVRQVFLIAVGSAKTMPDPYTIRRWESGHWSFDTWPALAFSGRGHCIHQIHDLEAMQWYLGREF